MSEEARKAAFQKFSEEAEKDGFLVLDDVLNQEIFAGGWNAHGSHTAAIREKAEALVAALYGAMSSYAGESDDPCERDEIFIDNFEEELTALKAALEADDGTNS